MTGKGYQHGFSDLHPDVYFDIPGRMRKAEKMLSIIRDFAGQDLRGMSVLDIGCSTGFMCDILSNHFGEVIGIDIDDKAIAFATEKFGKPAVRFAVADAMDTRLPASSVDTVICAHVYEHVPDPYRMLAEIHRVLRPGGICYFAAENKFVFREGDYRLPFLSILPKWLAHRYVRFAGKGTHYYETLFTVWGLRRLVKRFEIMDYTHRVVEDPEKFHAADVIRPSSTTQKIALKVVRYFYWMFPTYIWLLRKQNEGNTEIA